MIDYEFMVLTYKLSGGKLYGRIKLVKLPEG